MPMPPASEKTTCTAAVGWVKPKSSAPLPLGWGTGPVAVRLVHWAASSSQAAGPKKYPHLGKGYEAADGRPDLTHVDTEDPDYMQEATVPLANESHGGDDVGIWARGPGSQAVRGSLEQNAIFHILLQATPRLRATLCAKGLCDANGVPVELPKP